MAKILAFSGSARKESYNQRLVQIAAQGAQLAGAEVTLVNLADYPMPIFDQDLEAAEGMPHSARAFKELLIAHDGFLIASPEYNSVYSALLKNAIDWASRRQGEEAPLLAFRGKLAVIMSASPGALGGLRGLMALRMLLANIGITVLANQLTLSHAEQAFHPERENLIDDDKQDAAIQLGAILAEHIIKLKQ
jgi:NAD(P)H-dependent FMN reductase